MLTSFVSIIRIALRLLLSSVTMFCIWATCHRLFLAVTLIVYCIRQVDGTNIDPVDSGVPCVITLGDGQ
jgi:hypothetical protein